MERSEFAIKCKFGQSHWGTKKPAMIEISIWVIISKTIHPVLGMAAARTVLRRNLSILLFCLATN